MIDLDDGPIEVKHPLVHEDGVFFSLPESEYHSAFGLSSSGIKHLRQSTLDFWARSPLSPTPVDEDSEAKIVGSAYHKRLIEGRATFEARYAPDIDPAAYPGALRTNDDLKEAIVAAGGPDKRIKSMRKAELIETLLQCDPGALIWDRLVAAHNAKHDGKTMLPASLIAKIEIAAAMIEKHPQLCKAFTGGMPETSIFWHDRETGVPCKARLDYWKPKAIVDLKSFDNSIGLPIRKAIARAIANYRYHIQSAFYLRGVTEARRLMASGAVYGDVPPEMVKALQASNDVTWLFVFQQKGVAPLARGMVLGRGSVMDIGRMEIEQALVLFARCWATYGADPWLDIADVDTFDDTEFPAYLSE